MNISDLNYLEVVNSETGNAVTGAGDINFNITKYVNLNKTVKLDIDKYVDTHVKVKGQLATSEADAEVFGYKDALAEVDAYTYVDKEGGLTFAYAESTSAGIHDGGKDCYGC
ncbi:MAG: hypothetical protein QNJ60_12080 [Xenococcaceae cyanobacterium MO_188.B19]|nr:hypothetical protein [Xenococcaceae cyanobacterium MO_188.B19]